jgi:hypothetical protein
MDVGAHSSASSATKADAVPVFARAVSSCGTASPPPVVAAWIASSWARCNLIGGEALRGGLGARLDAAPDGDAG